MAIKANPIESGPCDPITFEEVIKDAVWAYEAVSANDDDTSFEISTEDDTA